MTVGRFGVVARKTGRIHRAVRGADLKTARRNPVMAGAGRANQTILQKAVMAAVTTQLKAAMAAVITRPKAVMAAVMTRLKAVMAAVKPQLKAVTAHDCGAVR